MCNLHLNDMKLPVVFIGNHNSNIGNHNSNTYHLKVESQTVIWNTGTLKVAHHIWIKFLNSRRNSLMMKNEVTYDQYG